MAALRDVGQAENYATVNSYMNRSLHFSNAVAEFIQKKCSLHKQFADQLETLLSTSKKQVTELLEKKKYSREANQLVELWDTLMLVTETEYHSVKELSESVNKKVLTGFNAVIEKKKAEIKEINKDKSALEAQIQKLEADVDKSAQFRLDAIKPLAKKKSSSAKSPSDDTPFLNARSAHNDYVMLLKQTNATRKRFFETDLPEIMDRLQDQQQELETATKDAIEGLARCTTIAYEPMAALQEKVMSTAQQTDLTQDIPNFVATLPATPYKPPADINFQYPSEKGLDSTWTQCALIVSGAEVGLGQTMQTVSEEVNTLASAIAEKNKAIIALEKLKSTYEGETKFGSTSDVQSQISTAIKERRALHMKMQGLCAVLEMLQLANISDADGGQRHDFRKHTYKKAVKCCHCNKSISMFTQGLRCKRCRINIHDKCRVHGSACGSGPTVVRPSGSLGAASSDPQVPGDEYEEVWSDDDDESVAEASTPGSTSSYPVSAPRTPASASQPILGRATALYDYQAANSDELTIAAGDVIELEECTEGEPWWSGRCGGRRGLIPASYVKKIEASAATSRAPPRPPPVTQPAAAAPARPVQAHALHPFAGVEDGQLSFPANATIEVIEGDRDGWSTGRYDGEEGIFPTSYVSFD